MIRLNRELPFVRAVFAHTRGGNGHAEAVQALREAEAKTGVILLQDLDGRLDWLYAACPAGSRACSPGAAPMPLAELMARLAPMGGQTAAAHEREACADELLAMLDSVYGAAVAEEEYERDLIFPFLTATELIIQGTSFTNNHMFFFTDPRDPRAPVHAFGCWWSMRGWGATLAEWAAQAGWQTGETPLGYVDFYVYADHVIEDYGAFETAALEVLAARSQEFFTAAGARE